VIRIADNLQITHKTVARAVREMDPEPIRTLARKCKDAGAQAIDVNSGPLSRDPEKKMAFLVDAVQEAVDLPILIDTTNPRAMKAGLQAAKNRAVINGFSLEPAKLEQILPLAGQFNADIIGYLLYPNSQVPPDEAGRLSVAVELFTEFQKLGIDNDRLIIDPIIAPLMWEDGNTQNMHILSVLRNLPDLLGFSVRTIGGLSNLTTGPGPKDRKRLMEQTYLPMLAASGLTMALMNVFHEETMETASACDALTEKKIFTWAA
jgi:5-methyltetrahydrofolate corrinoid/iron sulfur protein methyltransferase